MKFKNKEEAKTILEDWAQTVKNNNKIKKLLDEAYAKLDEAAQVAEEENTPFVFELNSIPHQYLPKKAEALGNALYDLESEIGYKEIIDLESIYQDVMGNFHHQEQSGWHEFWNTSSLWC